MNSSTQKPVALVTGASSGMGRDFALSLLAEGYVVYGAARRIDKMSEIVTRGGATLAMDVTDEVSIQAGVDKIIAEQGRIDVLINNAGYGQYGALEDVPLELARKQFEVNLFGLARLTQICLPQMRAQGSGRIINISSIGGKMATPLGGWYHASKFALEGWSDALRNEVRQFGIDVVVVEPGGVASEWAGIAREEAVRHSGNGAYSRLVEAFVKAQSMLEKAAPPSAITDLIVDAVTSRRPKIRYVGGYLARPILFMRRWLSDRMFDRLIMSSFK